MHDRKPKCKKEEDMISRNYSREILQKCLILNNESQKDRLKEIIELLRLNHLSNQEKKM